MSADDHEKRKAMRVRPGRYEVDYGPPQHGRFKPGQSGNPRGPPKGSTNKPKLPAFNAKRIRRSSSRRPIERSG